MEQLEPLNHLVLVKRRAFSLGRGMLAPLSASKRSDTDWSSGKKTGIFGGDESRED